MRLKPGLVGTFEPASVYINTKLLIIIYTEAGLSLLTSQTHSLLLPLPKTISSRYDSLIMISK